MPLIGAYANAVEAVASPAGPAADRRVAVLPHAAADEGARRLLREAAIECITTLAGEDLTAAEWLCRELAQAQGWRVAGPGAVAPGHAVPGDVVGWYEVRIAHGGSLLTTDRPITRLHGGHAYIASFNLLGQGRLNRALGDMLHRRLADDGIVPGSAFDVVVCAESKAVGMAQALVDRFGLDRYVVLRKGVKNYMPRRPRRRCDRFHGVRVSSDERHRPSPLASWRFEARPAGAPFAPAMPGAVPTPGSGTCQGAGDRPGPPAPPTALNLARPVLGSGPVTPNTGPLGAEGKPWRSR